MARPCRTARGAGGAVQQRGVLHHWRLILGHGVDRSGIMAKVTRPIVRVAGSSERRLVSLVSAAVGAISAFMQNIGAAALFLPALLRIAKRTGLPESRLLMPVGFAAILGGTLTMVASGPLIILNDILLQGGQASFGLFAVTPVGLTLLIAGILYFLDAYTQPLRMEDACREIGVGLRTLQRCFARYFQMTPHQYLTLLRYNKARRALLSHDPTTNSVTCVAVDSGFQHFGRFATGYRNLFGELPRDTLAAKPPAIAA